MTRFLHLTDLHITAPETDDPSQQTDTVATLEHALEIADRLSPRPDFIIASGDLTNIGDLASYRHLAQRFDSCDIPVFMTLGNHDNRAAWHTAFPGHPAAPDGPVDQDRVLAGIHIIAVDSAVPGQVSGALDSGQLQFVQTCLARHPELPKLVVVHHPPRLDPMSNHNWAHLDQHSTDQLADLLKGQNVLAVLSGHIHLNRFAMWNQIPLVVNTGQQSSVDVTRSDTLSVIQGTAFALCDLLPGGLQVTYVPLGTPEVIKEIPIGRLLAFS